MSLAQIAKDQSKSVVTSLLISVPIHHRPFIKSKLQFAPKTVDIAMEIDNILNAMLLFNDKSAQRNFIGLIAYDADKDFIRCVDVTNDKLDQVMAIHETFRLLGSFMVREFMDDFLKNRKIFKWVLLSENHRQLITCFERFEVLRQHIPRPAPCNWPCNCPATAHAIMKRMEKFMATYAIIAALFEEYKADPSVGDPTTDLSALDLTERDFFDVSSLAPDAIPVKNFAEAYLKDHCLAEPNK
jgi:hypothetical protein